MLMKSVIEYFKEKHKDPKPEMSKSAALQKAKKAVSNKKKKATVYHCSGLSVSILWELRLACE